METDDLREHRWLFTRNGKDVWRVKCWCAEPTVTLVNIETGEEIEGAVYSRNMHPFVALVPIKELEDA